MSKYIHFQFEMCPVQHVAGLINRDLDDNPEWELVAIMQSTHMQPNPNSRIIQRDKKEPKFIPVQMGMPIYRVKEEHSDKLPKAPQGIDKNGDVIVGPDNPDKPM